MNSDRADAADTDTHPLLELVDVGRTYGTGASALTVLHGVNLRIHAGEMVAIVGASGSGKSTLMNILGCLDVPSQGTYRIAGAETHTLGNDELASLRRDHFGFVFQRYQLLEDQTAQGNVETPAVYAGASHAARRARAASLLSSLGLGERLGHRPAQLSGGQQQRVGIARALMNGGQVILADEPTGALDSRSSAELMALLVALNQAGHTIVIVTHDWNVARHARRIIEIKDGGIVADQANEQVVTPVPPENGDASVCAGNVPGVTVRPPQRPVSRTFWLAIDGVSEAFRLAMASIWSHRLRSFLTMLGIVIGIASVVCVVALGEGSRQRILDNIRSFGSNTIDVFPGRSAGDLRAGIVHTLNLRDVDVLRAQAYVDSVTPVVSFSATLRYRNVAVNSEVYGVGQAYFRVHGVTIAKGGVFSGRNVEMQDAVAVIDERTQQALFGSKSAFGQVMLVGNVPCRVVGISKLPNQWGGGGMLNVWMPYTSAMTRMSGSRYLQSVTVRIADGVSSDAALNGVTMLLTRLHGRHDFNTFSSDELMRLATRTSENMSLLISAIALIALLVGGIGVMNIMLVSVTERVHEIGVRMAVGARQRDIQYQFLLEAVLICLFGGVIGILLALGIGWGGLSPKSPYPMIFSTKSIVVAFLSATVIGIVFGYVPARRAANLNPIDAMARE